MHTTEDQIYRYWDTWLTTGEVPHLFRVDVETGQQTDLTPGSTRWWSWPNTDDPWDNFDISPDGRFVVFLSDRAGELDLVVENLRGGYDTWDFDLL